MTTLCHHCHRAVPEAAPFCPECGAPQLRVGEEETQEPEAAEAVLRHTGDIAWPSAVSSAALFSIPAGVLLSFLAIPLVLDLMGVVFGAVWTLRRYRRRSPRAPLLTPQLGGRIGLVVGLFAALIGSAGQAVWLLVERFGLHRTTDVHAILQLVLERYSELKTMDPQYAAGLAQASHFLATPQGQAFFTLFNRAFYAAIVLLFAWLGGRFAVRYGWVRRGRG
jgi:hypothetical protein